MSLAAVQSRGSLIDRAGVVRSLGAHVVGLTFLENGILAAALGDGRIAFLGPGDASAPSIVPVHDGACLSLAVDFDGRGVLTGGDDGRLMRTDSAGEIIQILSVAGRWVEPIAVSPASSLRAVAVGKTVYLVDRNGAPTATFDHANTCVERPLARRHEAGDARRGPILVQPRPKPDCYCIGLYRLIIPAINLTNAKLPGIADITALIVFPLCCCRGQFMSLFPALTFLRDRALRDHSEFGLQNPPEEKWRASHFLLFHELHNHARNPR